MIKACLIQFIKGEGGYIEFDALLRSRLCSVSP